jgi:hypothetical protein
MTRDILSPGLSIACFILAAGMILFVVFVY